MENEKKQKKYQIRGYKLKKKGERVVCHGQKNVSFFFVFISAVIFAFITFMTNTHLWGKDISSRKKLFYKYLTLIFWMLRVAKYLVYDFTFTF